MMRRPISIGAAEHTEVLSQMKMKCGGVAERKVKNKLVAKVQSIRKKM